MAGVSNAQLRTELKEDIREVFDLAKQNQRTLRGSNGDKGLVTQVETIAKSVEAIVNTHLPTMKKELLAEIQKDREKNVTFPGLAAWFSPVVSGLIVAILVSVIHALFF